MLDRPNWKIGTRHVNLLVLAVKTRHSQAPLMWTVLDRAGNSDAESRIALLDRHIALFGQASIAMALADREPIGAEWLNSLTERDIPFTIRRKQAMHVTTAQGRAHSLAALLTHPGCARRITATLTGP